MKATIKVWNSDPESGVAPGLVSYEVPYQEGDTVLQALLNIYESQEPIAFRYGCRFKKCGLCAMEINGRPRLACRTPLKDGLTVKPLRSLPVIRDLVIDRDPAFRVLIPLQPWLVIDGPEGDRRTGEDRRTGDRRVPSAASEGAGIPERRDTDRRSQDGRAGDRRVASPSLRRLIEPEEHKRLMACTECLGCLSTCPSYRHDDPLSGGPFQFVKLAQMHFHPLDRLDRPAQARSLSIDRCASCLKCRCIIGIPIVKMAILPLMEGAAPR